jgi:hypothetical protein
VPRAFGYFQRMTCAAVSLAVSVPGAAGHQVASPGRWAVRADLDDALFGASLVFAGAAVCGSAVAIRDQLPGRPLGITVPLSVPAGLVAGWGAGVAVPWPMPVAAVAAAAAARRRAPSPRPGIVCAVIGAGCIVGTLIEPVTHRPGSWSRATAVAIGFNLAASAGLIAAGLRHSAGTRAQNAASPAAIAR